MIQSKDLKKQKEKMEKLMSVIGEDYNHWLFQQQQKYIEENGERVLDELLTMKEKYSSQQTHQPKQEVPYNEERQQLNEKGE